jgi:RNA polymerase sigma-70 factor (ECF subfamily)
MSRRGDSAPEQWMACFQQSLDGEAFERIVCQFTQPALGVAVRLLGDRALAEDAVQEAFLRVVRNRGDYQPGRPFGAWFYAILRNVSTDLLRRRMRELGAVKEVARQAAPAAEPTAAAEPPALLRLLPAGERDVLELRVVQGLTFSEIAAATGLSEAAAKKRAQRGLRRLRERLGEAHHHPAETEPQRAAL